MKEGQSKVKRKVSKKYYNEDDVNNALEQGRNGMSTREAAIKYKVFYLFYKVLNYIYILIYIKKIFSYTKSFQAIYSPI